MDTGIPFSLRAEGLAALAVAHRKDKAPLIKVEDILPFMKILYLQLNIIRLSLWAAVQNHAPDARVLQETILRYLKPAIDSIEPYLAETDKREMLDWAIGERRELRKFCKEAEKNEGRRRNAATPAGSGAKSTRAQKRGRKSVRFTGAELRAALDQGRVPSDAVFHMVVPASKSVADPA